MTTMASDITHMAYAPLREPDDVIRRPHHPGLRA